VAVRAGGRDVGELDPKLTGGEGPIAEEGRHDSRADWVEQQIGTGHFVGPDYAELVAAKAAWRDPELKAIYRRHRPMAERAISWLVANDNRRLCYRGLERDESWLKVRLAALNLRRLLARGLDCNGTGALTT